MSNSFGQTFRYFRASGKAKLLPRILGAVIYAAIAIGLTIVLPKYADSVTRLFPDYLFSGLPGTVYAYTVVTMICLLLFRTFSNRLFTYTDVTDGHCYFAMGNGAKASSILAAKYFSGLLAPASTYVLGAALTFGACYFLGLSFDGLLISLLTAAVGLCALLLVHSVQLLVGAVGGNGLLVGAIGFVMSFLTVGYLFLKGFFNTGKNGDIPGSVREILSFQLTGLLIPFLFLLLLSFLICMTVPKKRLSAYEVEDLDTDMLRQLQFGTELEVYEKNEEEYELLFAGKDVLDD